MTIAEQPVLPADNGARSMAAAAYAAIKQEIIRCAWPPGAQITEGQLAKRHGVGRAAVRLALNRLAQEALVQVVARQGYVVAPLTWKQVDELSEVRLILESAAVRRAAGRIDPPLQRHLDELSRITYQLDRPNSLDPYILANQRFHVAIARASGVDKIADLLDGVLDEMARIMYFCHLLGDINEESLQDHQALLDALLANDPERAVAVVTGEIVGTKQGVLDALLIGSAWREASITLR